MATTASASIEIAASVNYVNTQYSWAVFAGAPKISNTLSLNSSAVSLVFTSQGTLTVATDFDLTSVTDPYGTTIAFTTVKAIVLYNTSATSTITVGAGTNPLLATDKYTVKAGACLPITSAFAVDSTHKVLRLTPSAACGYQMLVIGS